MTHKSALVDILIVDDIEFNIKVLKYLIESLKDSCKCGNNHRDCSIHFANSGKQAVELVLYQNSVDSGYRLIFMDCLMPEMDGWEAAKRIKDLYLTKKIKILPFIVAYSAFDSKEDLEKCKAVGMCGHVSKPAYKEEVCREIRKWLNMEPL